MEKKLTDEQVSKVTGGAGDYPPGVYDHMPTQNVAWALARNQIFCPKCDANREVLMAINKKGTTSAAYQNPKGTYWYKCKTCTKYIATTTFSTWISY